MHHTPDLICTLYLVTGNTGQEAHTHNYTADFRSLKHPLQCDNT